MDVPIAANLLRYALKDCYFINGTAYAGKSTMVKRLAEKHGGICCGENYHDVLMEALDPACQPNLSYFQTMGSWQEFISRSPEAYEAWVDGNEMEIAQMEIIVLLRLSGQGKKIFVDTNIPPAWLKEIADYHHSAIMLCPQKLSVERFFDRSDPEKQFLLRQIEGHPDPEWAMENFRACIARINSPERYRAFAESGLWTWVRGEDSTVEGALAALEGHFGL